MSHVLIDAAGKPVPLPFHTAVVGDSFTRVDGFDAPDADHPTGMIVQRTNDWPYIARRLPEVHGLLIITEEEFQRTRAALDKEEEA
jgi:hypothetical protein